MRRAACIVDAPAMQAFIARVAESNCGRRLLQQPAPLWGGTAPAAAGHALHVPFVLAGPCPYGYVSPIDCEILVEFKDTFTWTERALYEFSSKIPQRCITLVPDLLRPNCSEADRTAAVGHVMSALRERGVLTRWYGELFPVVKEFGEEPALLLERGAYTLLGIKGYGVHINGFVNDPTKHDFPQLWVAQRSATKATYPNMFDCVVGGGQPYGLSLMENVIKECQEEASIPSVLASSALPVGAISYVHIEAAPNGAQRVTRDTLFSFDLELPVDFVPHPSDGEVQDFQKRDAEWVLGKVAEGGSSGFKSNINLTMLDFLIRHGVISSDSPQYLELIAALHRP